jgi:serine/threonine protein kinase
MPLVNGTLIGSYQILALVGAGGMGEVYRARDTRLGRTVAVRLLAPELTADAARLDRFLSRARAAAALSHPNIAALYEVGEDSGRPFLVSEFAAGEPLRSIIGGRPLSPRRVADLGAQMADALAEAHAGDMACGGLTSSSVVVTPKGQAKILDAGLSDRFGGADRPGSSDGEGDRRRDIASLGALLSEMLTGKPGAEAGEQALAGELGAIVAKALGRGSGDGYESAATLAAELRAVGAILDVRAAAAEPSAVVVRHDKRSPNVRLWLALLAGALAALVWLLA